MFEKIKELFTGKYLDWEEYENKMEALDRQAWRENIRKENLKNKIFSS